MVVYGQGVWLALQGSAQVRLYHAQTWETLTEVDVAPAVHKMLAGKYTWPEAEAALTVEGDVNSLQMYLTRISEPHGFPSAQVQTPSSDNTKLPVWESQHCWPVKIYCGLEQVQVKKIKIKYNKKIYFYYIK